MQFTFNLLCSHYYSSTVQYTVLYCIAQNREQPCLLLTLRLVYIIASKYSYRMESNNNTMSTTSSSSSSSSSSPSDQNQNQSSPPSSSSIPSSDITSTMDGHTNGDTLTQTRNENDNNTVTVTATAT